MKEGKKDMKKIFLMIGMLLGINGFSDKNINKDNVKIKQSVIATTYTYPDGKNSFWNDILILGEREGSLCTDKSK